MYQTLLKLVKAGKLDEIGIGNAVKKHWITDKQAAELKRQLKK